MNFNRKNKQDYYSEFKDRVDRLKNTDTIPNDEQLAERFKQVFNSESTIKQDKPLYGIPKDINDKEIEDLLLQAELSDNDDYLDDILQNNNNNNNNHPISDKDINNNNDNNNKIDMSVNGKKIKELENLFLSSDRGDPPSSSSSLPFILNDQEQELLQQLRDQVAVEKKYEAYEKSRDQDLEKRYLALKEGKHFFTTEPTTQLSPTPMFDKPSGSIPKPISMDDFHDEMDDWCCVCNKDATIICEDCDDDKFCNECFAYGHQGSMADYEFTKHKAKRYISPLAK